MPLPITIPNTFANATATIPLSQLDNNFSTVAVAVNSIGNGAFTLANVQVTGGKIANVVLDNVSVDVETRSPRSVVITSQAQLPSSPADELVVLSLRPLGLPCDVDLPAGALDFATSVRTHGDYFAGPALARDRLALVDGQGEFTHSDLVTAWTDTARGDHERVLFCGTDLTATSIGQAWVATLVNQGSVVLVSPTDQSDERLTDLARQEGALTIIRG